MNERTVAKRGADFDADSFLNELFQYQKTGSRVFRCYKKDKQLKPTLLRRYDEFGFDENEHGMIAYEETVLKLFSKYCSNDLPSILTPLDFVAYAQHFGVPTRLIDWSFDPFCSLFFSINRPLEADDTGYYLAMANIETNMYFENIFTGVFQPMLSQEVTRTNFPLINEYVYFVQKVLSLDFNVASESIKTHQSKLSKDTLQRLKDYLDDESTSRKHKLFFCTCNDSNTRIIAQSGLFQIPRSFIDASGKDCIDQNVIEACETKYIIDKSVVESLLECLKKLGITKPKLFPDIVSKCQFIFESNPFDLL